MQPRTSHLQALQHTLKYIQGTIGQDILLRAPDKLILQSYSDSDWATCPYSESLLLAILFLLALPLLVGKARSRALYPSLPLKLNTGSMCQAAGDRLVSETSCRIRCAFFTACVVIFMTTNQLYTLEKILFFMRGTNV